ncbi:MAG: hypothetical protein WD602_05170 [Actinomycetota bacterium]
MSDLQATVDSAERAGFKLRPIEGVGDTVTAIDVDGNELYMGTFVLDWWKRGGDSGGLVIDLREDVENHLSREDELDPDYVAVLTDDGGDVMLDLKDLTQDKAEWFLEKVTCGDLEAAEDILELGKEAGGKVVSKRGRDGRYSREILWKPFRSRYYNPPTEDGLSVNPATEEFKKIKKTRQTFAERRAELREMYGEAFDNVLPGEAFHTGGQAQRVNPYVGKMNRQKSEAQKMAELEEALRAQVPSVDKETSSKE